MDAIISVQDIRTQLGTITKRVESGESFTVIRNSKPAFRLIPIEKETHYKPSKQPKMLLREIKEQFEANPVTKEELSPSDLDRIIHEVHSKK
jgi:prevent-host-death family protein